MTAQRLPTLESCKQDDPKEAFQWAFVYLPFQGSTPLLVQPECRPEWSQLFWDLGFRHHPELMTKKVRMPYRGDQHALNGSAQIVDIDDDGPEPVQIPDPAEYTAFEQQIMIERMQQIGRLPAPNPEVDKAKVEGAALFDPAEHSPQVVSGYLMACSPAEQRRVIAAEMTGKQREQILRKWRDV